MRILRSAPIFILLITSWIKSMEGPVNNFPKDVVGKFAGEIAAGKEDLDVRIADIRNFTLVNKAWNEAINDNVGLIIALLASEDTHDKTSKVEAAMKLGIKGTRNWLAEQYKDEEGYKELLFNLVKNKETLKYVRKMQLASEFCNRIANEQTDALLNQIEGGCVSCFPDKLHPMFLGTKIIKHTKPKAGQEEIANNILDSEKDDNLRLLLLKRATQEDAELLNKTLFKGKCICRFWCRAMLRSPLEEPFLKEILKHSIQLQDCCGRSLVQAIAENKRSDLMAELLKCPGITGNEVCLSSAHPLILALYQGSLDIAQQLISHPPCNINIVNRVTNDNETPLTLSIQQECFDIAQQLIARPDCDVNALDCKALRILVEGKYSELAQLLIARADCNINVLNSEILIKCIEEKYSDIAKCLIARPDCGVNSTGSTKRTPLQSRTPLMFAVLTSQMDIVELLLERPDIDLSKKDCNGYTAYELAVDLGYDEIAKKIKEAEDKKAAQK